MTALKSLVFLILAAGLGAAYIPFALLPSGPHVETGLFAYLAVPLWLLGGVTILWCFWNFTFTGHGTPAPIDPPKELGSPGIAVGANQGLGHQERLDEFSPFFGRVSPESLLAYGFVML